MSTYQEGPAGTFALWGYDAFPCLLGGEVTHMNPVGNVFVKGFGWGQGFRPIKILPTVSGTALLTELEGLREAYRDAEKALRADFDTRRDILLKGYGITL
jgi:hypothetical protein